MADAYDVMSMAKRSGAALQQKEDWEAYQDELAAAAKKRKKGGFWSGLASMGIAKLLPMLIPGVGAGAGLMSLLGVGAARAATQFGLGEAVRSMTGADTRAGAFKGTSTGPYGRKGAAQYKRQADMISKSIGDELAAGKRGRGFMALASSALADKEGWGDLVSGLGKKGVDVAALAESGEALTSAIPAGLEASEKAALADTFGATGQSSIGQFAQAIDESGLPVSGPVKGRTMGELLTSGGVSPEITSEGVEDILSMKLPDITEADFDFGGDAPNIFRPADSQPSIASVMQTTPSSSRKMSTMGRTLSDYGDFNLPSTGNPLDTMNILQGVGQQYKPESIMSKLFPSLKATQNPMMKNLLQQYLQRGKQ